MSFVVDNLKVDERVVLKAKVSKVVYVKGLLSFAVMMEPLSLMKSVSTELALTDKRVIGRTGIFGRKSILLPHKEIQGVRVIRGLLGILMRCGDVVITAKDGGRTTFKGIKKPLVFQDKINEAVEMAVLGRRLMDFDKPADTETLASEEPIKAEAAAPAVVVTPSPFPIRPSDEPVPKVDPDLW